METNAKVPPVQPATEQPTPQTKPDAATQDSQNPSFPSTVPAYIAEPGEYRLVIDKDPVDGSFIYKTVDRLTGKTVTQLPSEEVVRLKDSASYRAGSIYDGKA